VGQLRLKASVLDAHLIARRGEAGHSIKSPCSSSPRCVQFPWRHQSRHLGFEPRPCRISDYPVRSADAPHLRRAPAGPTTLPRLRVDLLVRSIHAPQVPRSQLVYGSLIGPSLRAPLMMSLGRAMVLSTSPIQLDLENAAPAGIGIEYFAKLSTAPGTTIKYCDSPYHIIFIRQTKSQTYGRGQPSLLLDSRRNYGYLACAPTGEALARGTPNSA